MSDHERKRYLTTEEAFEHMKKKRPDIFDEMTIDEFEQWLEDRVDEGVIKPPVTPH